MFGCVTPKRSILLLKILNERAIASSTSNFNTSITSRLVEENCTLSLKSGVEKRADKPVFGAGANFSYSLPNIVTKSS